jgi:transcriptional regulator with XRE-family HTH domain
MQRQNVNSRGIGMELARHRRVACMTLEQVGRQVGMSTSTLSRLENGKREPTSEEVAGILGALGVVGEGKNQLLARVRGASGSSGFVMGGESEARARMYQDFESEATVITNFEPMLVPGIAQTARYAQAVVSAIRVDEDDAEVEAMVGQRMSRKAILTRKRPPQLNLIMTEVALRQPIGGLKVMAMQVRSLIDFAHPGHVSVRIIPAAVLAHPGLGGQFVIFDFDTDPSVVFVEAHIFGLYRDDPHEVAVYRRQAESLLGLALDEAGSVELMRTIADDLDRS